MDRLKSLFFSFYREDPVILSTLSPLNKCRMCRSWDSICIDCLDLENFNAIGALINHLRSPIEELGLARKIVVRVPGLIQRTYLIAGALK